MLLALAALAALAPCADTPAVATPHAPARVLFASDRDSWQLFVVGLDGASARQISLGLDNKHEPALSPDGRTVAYVSDRDGEYHVYLADVDGANARRLAPGAGIEGSPTWSPDGRSVAFSRAGDIVVADAAGGAVRMLVDGPFDDAAPAWSPDGSRIAFLRNCQPHLVAASGGEPERIWLAPPCSGRVSWAPTGTVLTAILLSPSYRGGGGIHIFSVDGKAIRLLAGENRLDYQQPVWSPRDGLIAFSTQCPYCNPSVIKVIGTDGKGERALTRATRVQVERWVGDLDPSWSPDGRLVVFARNLAGTSQIYSAAPDGTDVRRISQSDFHELRPVASPDGRTIAFDRRKGEAGRTTLSTMSADGRGARVHELPAATGDLLGTPAWAPDSRRLAVGTSGGLWILDTHTRRWRRLSRRGFDPTWSPDGRRLAFSRPIPRAYWPEDQTEIWLIRSDGKGLRRLSHGCYDGAPDWSPDGREIAFQRHASIYARRVDGSGVRLVLQSRFLPEPLVETEHCTLPPATPDLPQDAVYANPEWSPDGTRIAAHTPLNDVVPDEGVVFVADRDGRNRMRVSSGAWPSWISG